MTMVYTSCSCFVPGPLYVPKLFYHPDVGEQESDLFSNGEDEERKMEPLDENMPFQWAQALFFIARLLSKFVYY